jgi:hypothetical protein
MPFAPNMSLNSNQSNRLDCWLFKCSFTFEWLARKAFLESDYSCFTQNCMDFSSSAS